MEKIMEDYEAELIFVLSDCDAEFVKTLAKHKVISAEAREELSTLDYDSLEHSRVKARYILRLIQQCLKSHSPLLFRFVNVLSQFDFSCKLGLLLKNTLSEFDVDQELLYAPLQGRHIPVLTNALAECSDKWEEISIALYLTKGEIEECKSGQTNLVKLNNALVTWQNHTNANLSSIKRALKDVGRPLIANDLDKRIKEQIESMRPVLKQRSVRTTEVESQSYSDVEVSDGKSILLGVEVQDSQSVSFQWMKGGKPLSDTSFFSGVDTSILLIKNVCQGMEGKYSCSIEDSSKRQCRHVHVHLTIKYCFGKKRLLEHYASLNEVQVSDESWPPVVTSNFIELALISENCMNTEYDYSVQGDMDDILKRKEKKDYKQLFNKYTEQSLVLVEGRPGSGKTTLANKLARDWATRPDILHGANLVFLLSLRFLSSRKIDNSLSDILGIFYNEEHTRMVTKQLEDTYGKGVCFIIDGLDEYHNSSILITSLLHKEKLPRAMVIVASRPIGTADLRHRPSVLVTQRIEVLGFSRKQILAYINKYPFKDGTAAKLEAYLNSHINVLHMCYLPVHAAMICYIYEQCKRIPDTETKMYEHFTDLTVKRKLRRDGKDATVRSRESLYREISPCFDRICKLAFDMTISSKQTIYESETDSDLSIDSDMFSLGLVTVDSTAKLLGFEGFYTFLHLTFQEYLSARYIAAQDEDEQIRIARDYQNKKEMLMVWKFYCGIVIFGKAGYSLLEQIMGSEVTGDMHRVHCAYESQQQEVCAYIMQDSSGCLSFKDHIFSPTDFNALNYVLSNGASHTDLKLENCVLNHSGIANTDNMDGIHYLTYSSNGDIKQFKLMNLWMAKFLSLEVLDLSQLVLHKNRIKALTDNLSLPCLEILKIRMPPPDLESADSLSLLSFNSSSLGRVEYFYTPNVDLSHRECMLYLLKSFNCKIVPLDTFSEDILSNLLDVDFFMVSNFLCLSTLILINCNMKDFQVRYLVDSGIVYETLKLDVNKISDVGAKYVAELELSELQCLTLSCNRVGNQGAIALADALRNNNKLIELDLQFNSIGDEGAVAIAKSLEDRPKNFLLRLSNLKITDFGAGRVLEYIPENEPVEQNPQIVRDIVSKQNSSVVSQAFECFKYLHTLNLSVMTSGEWQSEFSAKLLLSLLGSGLKHCVNLKILDLHSNEISDDDMVELVEGLYHCNLEVLDLEDNYIADYGGAALARWLRCFAEVSPDEIFFFLDSKTINFIVKHLNNENRTVVEYQWYNSHIMDLNLSYNKIGAEGAAALAYGVKGCSKLRSLNLQHNRISGDGAQALVKGLENCKLLQTLILDHNKFEHAPNCVNLETLSMSCNKLLCSIETFFNDRKCCSNLQFMDVRDNNPDGRSGKALGLALKHCKCLHELNIANNYMGWCIDQLVDGLKCCEELRILSIQNNYVNPQEAVLLFKGLMNCKKLRTLNFNSNELNKHAILALMDLLKSCTGIEDVSLVDCNIDDSGAIALVDGLVSCVTLRSLNIRNNPIVNTTPLIGKLLHCIIDTAKGRICPVVNH